jgi:outer membrane lipoprotein-sorting protein
MARALTLPLTLAVAFMPLSCLAFQDAILAHIQRNQARLQSYQGVLVERGLIPEGDLTSEMTFERPDRLVTRVKSPEPYRGTTFISKDDTLLLHWPQVGYAIRIDHLPHLQPQDYKQLVTDAYWYGIHAYDGELGDNGQVAGHPTVGVRYSAKESDNPNRRSSYQVYDRYSLPLAGEIRFAGNKDYAFRYESLSINPAIEESVFDLSLPPATLVTHWDLAGPNVELDQAKARANFSLRVPAQPPAGYALERLVQVDGPVPAFTFVYRKGIHYVLLTEYKDLGLRLAAAEAGVPLPAGSHHGKLLPGPLASTFTYEEAGIRYQVFANLPFEELLKISAGL